MISNNYQDSIQVIFKVPPLPLKIRRFRLSSIFTHSHYTKHIRREKIIYFVQRTQQMQKIEKKLDRILK